ncbi:hypothetical protein FZC84_01045 [Rossellomorea vietnamensis]|uniref:Uncharacterized protein n=1 Tax=Rossellomorea vietnamensis TaxID=218284 RepID=A0A5D4MIZ6_9BACI|nr:hypothetical protein [Rossellomorea vietnamensis]TYS01274.1 hypothetical protein FZC84_01045 [Rossellomorea vietnamensis]
MENKDLIALIAALLAFAASLISIGTSFYRTGKSIKASKESTEASNNVSLQLGNLTAETQGKQRFIETISMQRVQWINSVRDNFSHLSKITYTMADIRERKEPIPDTLKNELYYYVNHLELFLNPTEDITKVFIELKDKVSHYLLSDTAYSSSLYEELMHNLHYVEQVILKAEWKRLKIETLEGTEVRKMKKIHRKTARKIDEERYDLLLKNYYERQE